MCQLQSVILLTITSTLLEQAVALHQRGLSRTPLDSLKQLDQQHAGPQEQYWPTLNAQESHGQKAAVALGSFGEIEMQADSQRSQRPHVLADLWAPQPIHSEGASVNPIVARRPLTRRAVKKSRLPASSMRNVVIMGSSGEIAQPIHSEGVSVNPSAVRRPLTRRAGKESRLPASSVRNAVVMGSSGEIDMTPVERSPAVPGAPVVPAMPAAPAAPAVPVAPASPTVPAATQAAAPVASKHPAGDSSFIMYALLFLILILLVALGLLLLDLGRRARESRTRLAAAGVMGTGSLKPSDLATRSTHSKRFAYANSLIGESSGLSSDSADDRPFRTASRPVLSPRPARDGSSSTSASRRASPEERKLPAMAGRSATSDRLKDPDGPQNKTSAGASRWVGLKGKPAGGRHSSREEEPQMARTASTDSYFVARQARIEARQLGTSTQSLAAHVSEKTLEESADVSLQDPGGPQRKTSAGPSRWEGLKGKPAGGRYSSREGETPMDL